MTASAGRIDPPTPTLASVGSLPDWLPRAVEAYIVHTGGGLSLREVARRRGCHASTVMRQVRRYENRRDDPLVDEALEALSRGQLEAAGRRGPHSMELPMTAPIRTEALDLPEAVIATEARRVLTLLSRPKTFLAIAPDMDKAAVLREGIDGAERIAVVDRAVAQVFALKDWIACHRPGRVAAYVLSPAGRAALRRMESRAAARLGRLDAGGEFAAQHRDMAERDDLDADGTPRRLRYNAAESPVSVLARKRDKDGKTYLEPDLVRAAEQLRVDFEMAQMGPRIAQNWDRFLTGADRGMFRADAGLAEGPRAARDRVMAALADLGPGLSDVVLRCCCFLEGLETAERRMGWAARSAKIVLRIALQRLKRHYDETYGPAGPRIG